MPRHGVADCVCKPANISLFAALHQRRFPDVHSRCRPHESGRAPCRCLPGCHLCPAHAGAVPHPAGILGLRQNPARRRQPGAGRFRARCLWVNPGIFPDPLRHRLRSLGAQAGHRHRAGDISLGQFRRRLGAGHDVDHHRPRIAGRWGDFGGGHGIGGRPDARGAPDQGDGDDRLVDRPRLRAVAGRGAAALWLDRHGRPVLDDRRAGAGWRSSCCSRRCRRRRRRTDTRSCRCAG